jgi:hypothetical protein
MRGCVSRVSGDLSFAPCESKILGVVMSRPCMTTTSLRVGIPESKRRRWGCERNGVHVALAVRWILHDSRSVYPLSQSLLDVNRVIVAPLNTKKIVQPRHRSVAPTRLLY